MNRSNLFQIRRVIVLAIVMLLATLGSPSASDDNPAAVAAPSSVTLPLDEILRLYRLPEDAPATAEPPPVAATIDQMRLSARVLEDALDVTILYTITILDDEHWVDLPLLTIGPHTHVVELPTVDGVSFARVDGTLRLLTRRLGQLNITLSVLEAAVVGDDDIRRVAMSWHEAALVRAEIVLDEQLFRLTSPRTHQRKDTHLVFPSEPRLAVSWQRLQPVATGVADADAPRPVAEPVIRKAWASVVSTLEGRRITRVLYDLSFEGRQRISATLPAGQRLDRLYVDGAPRPFEVVDGKVALEVTPARAGDTVASLEMVLMQDGGSYDLSGELSVTLPALSWTIHRLSVELHLPKVFTYTWNGGSLAPAEQTKAPSYTYDMPTPGRDIALTQSLIVGSSPHVTVDYSVDLKGKFYR